MTKRITGIGYQANRLQRINEGFGGNRMEAAGNEQFTLYFGRAHLTDHETGVQTRGYMKIGRGKFPTAIQRGRNQPGVDFRIYVEIILTNNNATYEVEKIVSAALKHKHMQFDQGQSEMYDISDEELPDILSHVAKLIQADGIEILQINIYDNDKKISVPFN